MAFEWPKIISVTESDFYQKEIHFDDILSLTRINEGSGQITEDINKTTMKINVREEHVISVETCYWQITTSEGEYVLDDPDLEERLEEAYFEEL